MVELKCPASQLVSSEDNTSFRTTLGGRRIARVPTLPERRTWQCQLSDASTPEQIGPVMAFIHGEWGNGPFVFVSADAPATNMLTPDASSCDPGAFMPQGSTGLFMEGGPMRTPDGWAGRSVLNSGGFPFWRDIVPVLPGVPVTASVYARGAGGYLRITWVDGSGASMMGTNSLPVAGTGTERIHATALPPAGAAGCRLSMTSSITQATRPAVTWTDTPLEWADGQGCEKAVIHGASRDLIQASRDLRGGRYSSLSFTISEVG